MFRILLVEDDARTREGLLAYLESKLPDWWIDTAETVREGEDLIAVAVDETAPYDAALLDFYLPLRRGVTATFNETLCDLMRRKLRGAFVLHITSRLSDEPVLKHLRTFHLRENAPTEVVDTQKNGWDGQVLELLQVTLHSRRVERQLNQLFQGGGPVPVGHRRREGTAGSSLTQRLASLSREISANWDFIDEINRERVESLFDVNTAKSPVQVTFPELGDTAAVKE